MRRWRRWQLGVGGVVVAVLAVAACGNDDGKGLPSAKSGTSASGAGEPAIAEAVARYEAYVKGQVATLVGVTKAFTDAVRAGDVEAAKAAYAISRSPWEAIEPIAGLVSDIDGAVD